MIGTAHFMSKQYCSVRFEYANRARFIKSQGLHVRMSVSASKWANYRIIGDCDHFRVLVEGELSILLFEFDC